VGGCGLGFFCLAFLLSLSALLGVFLWGGICSWGCFGGCGLGGRGVGVCEVWGVGVWFGFCGAFWGRMEWREVGVLGGGGGWVGVIMLVG